MTYARLIALLFTVGMLAACSSTAAPIASEAAAIPLEVPVESEPSSSEPEQSPSPTAAPTQAPTVEPSPEPTASAVPTAVTAAEPSPEASTVPESPEAPSPEPTVDASGFTGTPQVLDEAYLVQWRLGLAPDLEPAVVQAVTNARCRDATSLRDGWLASPAPAVVAEGAAFPEPLFLCDETEEAYVALACMPSRTQNLFWLMNQLYGEEMAALFDADVVFCTDRE